MKRALALATLGLITLTVSVSTAQAAPDLTVTVEESKPITAPGGTFSLAGDLSDSGTFVFTSFFLAAVPSPVVATVHVTEALSGTAGTLSIKKQCLSVFIGFGLSDECQGVVVGETGAYAGLHGIAKCSGIVNFITGIASQTCELRLKT